MHQLFHSGSGHLVSRDSDAVALRAALLYGGIFAAMGVRIPFFPVWLKAEGVDPRMIGFALGAAAMARIAAVAASTQIADRFQASRGTLIVLTAATAGSYALAGLAPDHWMILFAAVVALTVFSPVLPLTDAHVLKALADRGTAYGTVRLWGSAAFVAGNLGAAWLLSLVAPSQLIWLIIAVYLAPAIISITLPQLEGPLRKQTNAISSPGKLLSSPAVIAAVASASLIQGSHAFYYGFSTLAWLGAGFDVRLVSALWTLGVIAEIVLLAFSGRLLAVLSPAQLLLIGAVGATIRWTVMMFEPSMPSLVLAQFLHAASYGATLLGAIHFVGRAVSDRLAATAQGFLSISQSLVSAGAMSVSGILFVRYGSLGYGAMAGLAAAGGICVLIALHVSSKQEPL